MVGVTSALAKAGVVDYRWVGEEALFKGSEVHRIIQLSTVKKLARVPRELEGYGPSHTRFMKETGFIIQHVEHNLEDAKLGVRGRLDAAGLFQGKLTVCEYKSGNISPATALQLALYGFLMDSSKWWQRIAVEIRSDKTYRMRVYPKLTWVADLATALACVRVAQGKGLPEDRKRILSWKLLNKVA